MGRSTVNFIPRPDAAFDAWVKQYAAAQAAWWSSQGLAAAALADFTRAYNAWLSAFPAHVRARATAEAARVTKDAARAGLEAALRPLARIIQADPDTSDADRARLGITIKASVRGGSGGAGWGGRPPSSRPLLIIDVAARLTHTVRLADESTPTSLALPRGVQRAELFVALTHPHEPPPAPPPPDQPGSGAYRYLGSFTRTPTRLTFEPPRGGMQAHYLARWASARGGVGGWSETASATIAA